MSHVGIFGKFRLRPFLRNFKKFVKSWYKYTLIGKNEIYQTEMFISPDPLIRLKSLMAQNVRINHNCRFILHV
jgi:hypothetical protein